MVYSIIESGANRWADKVVIYDDQGSLTFKDLHLAVEKLKDALKKEGLDSGMGLGVMARNSRQFVIACFAGLGCGATILPISHQIKEAELEAILAETRLHFILDDKNGVTPPIQEKAEIDVEAGSLRLSQAKTSSLYKIADHIENPAFIRFTSGTTGKSKGVIISHSSVIERIEAANRGLKLSDEDTVVWVLPMAYHFIVSIVLYLNVGASIAICNDFLAPAILEYANRYKATLLYASPMHIRLLASDKSSINFTTMKRVISTSTSLPYSITSAFKNRFNLNVSQAYGIIEIGLPIINTDKSEEHPEAVGYVLPDYRAEILSEDFHIVTTGEVGQLGIQGPGMFDGYLNPPSHRSEFLKDGWFLTGDLATKTEEGLIIISGRKKSMINVSGNKAFPEEIEQVLESHPGVEAARVFGGSHPLMGEIVQAEVILKKDFLIESEELISYCRIKLSTYKVPQRIIYVEEIQSTGSGKKVRS